jgi:hypothetical protein
MRNSGIFQTIEKAQIALSIVWHFALHLTNPAADSRSQQTGGNSWCAAVQLFFADDKTIFGNEGD